jgi:DNA repair exonuclease SbcCD ATPase subunit
MKIIEFSYKNILSYGNKVQTFKFEDKPSLILVEGENGAGKSTIKEALTISIYGRSAIRKMKDVPNWINKNAYTNVKFMTTSGETIEIDRGIEPNFSDIKINGAHFNLPDKRKVDEFVEEELSKIPFSVFSNTISLSFDDFKSFINLSKDDKRKIIDRIFGIDILFDMRTKVKDELKKNKAELDIIESTHTANSLNLESYEDQVKELEEKLTSKKEKEIESLTLQIAEKKKEVAELIEERKAITSSHSTLSTECATKREEISKTKSNIREVKAKLTVYDQNRCPHCLNDLHSDSSQEIKGKLEDKVKAFEAKLPALEKDYDESNDKLTDLLLQKSDLDSKYYTANANLSSLETSLEAAQETKDDDQLSSIKKIISDLKDKIKDDVKKIEDLTKVKNINLRLDDLLSDNGIKKSMIDKIIPTLNARILEISKKLEFKFAFEFNSDFDPNITYLGMQVSPESLSSGQRKKMNLIVLLSFIEIIKMKHSQMNVMFLDEIFSSLDKNNVYRAISILKEYATLYNMTIFVVSHEALPEELFDSKIIVTTQDHFSDMQITKIG